MPRCNAAYPAARIPLSAMANAAAGMHAAHARAPLAPRVLAALRRGG